ncbi:MAG: hypothetical protein AVDCRST_MAG32-2825, partial [uncultured Nocardioides sp.]
DGDPLRRPVGAATRRGRGLRAPVAHLRPGVAPRGRRGRRGRPRPRRARPARRPAPGGRSGAGPLPGRRGFGGARRRGRQRLPRSRRVRRAPHAAAWRGPRATLRRAGVAGAGQPQPPLRPVDLLGRAPRPDGRPRQPGAAPRPRGPSPRLGPDAGAGAADGSVRHGIRQCASRLPV